MSAATAANEKTKGTPPVAEVREGSVRIAIWERQGSKGTFYTAGAPDLSYKTNEGSWAKGSSYTENDLVDLMVATAKAKSKLRELRRAGQPQDDSDNSDE